MNFNDTLIIAVDFDGTIVEDAYPKIGKPNLFAFETLKKLQDEGHRLILWTYRCDNRLDEAVKFCESNGVFFYAVNSSFPEEKYSDAHHFTFISLLNNPGAVIDNVVTRTGIGKYPDPALDSLRSEDMPNTD